MNADNFITAYLGYMVECQGSKLCLHASYNMERQVSEEGTNTWHYFGTNPRDALSGGTSRGSQSKGTGHRRGHIGQEVEKRGKEHKGKGKVQMERGKGKTAVI